MLQWCEPCKELAPKYVDVAEYFKADSSVIIAKMDGTANDVSHPDVDLTGYPSIKFFPAGKYSA